MKKGITPIIAVIILLLITVALAGMAWAFLQGYFTQITPKNLQVSDNYCLGALTKVVFTNIGTDSINIGAAGAGSCSSAGGLGTVGTTAETVC